VNVKVILVSALLLAGCASVATNPASSPSQLDRLYFGRAIADTGVVTDSAWSGFLRDVVTPRFPEGITVLRAEGQWRGANGSIVREPSFVLEVVHQRTPAIETSLAEIIAEYKRRFHQEAVMRITSEVRARLNE
jgi:uncharacterized protein YceK